MSANQTAPEVVEETALAPPTVPPTNSKDVAAYTTTDAEIAKLSEACLKLTIDGIKDKEGFAAVRKARMSFRKLRVEIEKGRKAHGVEHHAWLKYVNGEAKRLTDLITPAELYLQAQEDKVTAEKQRIADERAAKEKAEADAQAKAEREKFAHRMRLLAAVGVTFPTFDIGEVSDEEFASELEYATEAFEAAKLAAEAEAQAKAERKAQEDEERRIERERIAKERAELDRQREEQAAEQRRVAEERAAHDKKVADERAAYEKQQAEERAETEWNHAEAQRAIDEERAAIDKEKREAREAEDKRVRAAQEAEAKRLHEAAEADRVAAEKVKAKADADAKVIREKAEEDRRAAMPLSELYFRNGFEAGRSSGLDVDAAWAKQEGGAA